MPPGSATDSNGTSADLPLESGAGTWDVPFAQAVAESPGPLAAPLRLSAGAIAMDSPYPTMGTGAEPKVSGLQAITPVRLLRALRRRWYIAVPLAVLAALILGYFADSYVRSDFTARTLVSVAIEQPYILFNTPDGRADLATYQRRQAALVRSRPVLQAALEQPGVGNLATVQAYSDPVAWLEKDLKTDFSTSPDILRITLNGPDSGELTILLDAIRESYLREGVNKEITEKKAAEGRLRRLIEAEQLRLREAQDAARSKAKEFHAPDVQSLRSRYQNNVLQASNLQLYLFQKEIDVSGWAESLREMEANPPDASAPAPVRAVDRKAATELALTRDQESLAAQADVDRLKAELNAFFVVSALGRDHPKVVEKEKELALATKRRDARTKVVGEEVATQLALDARQDLAVRRVEHEARMNDVKALIERTKGQLIAIAAKIKSLNAQASAEAQGIADLERQFAETTEIENRIKAANAKAEALAIELKAPPRAQTHEKAVITHLPNPTRKLRIVAAAIAVGFFGALLGVAYLDLRSGRIDSTDGMDRHLGTGVVGYIPRVRPAALAIAVQPNDVSTGSDERAVCDAVDACRTMLIGALACGGAKVIMVTSPMAREGKTTLAAQLAMSLGRAGYRTLLIDADMRQPGVHTAFGQPLGPGLADILRKTHSLSKVFQKSPFPTLLTIPAGQCHPQEAIPLLQHRMKSVIKKCKPYFEVILIDTPPLLHLPDALVIGRHADGTILSLMNDVSTLPAAQATCARLRLLNVPVLGAVLNGARVRGSRGYY
jgi:capsular exopolysaccharide synthesis family protein